MPAVAIVVLTLSACGLNSDSDDPYRLVVSGLCEAEEQAVAGDITGAETVFYDSVHRLLHDLAAETADVDRAAAARLLEAMKAVESGLETDQSDIGEAFRDLVAATDEALTATGHDRMPCAVEEES